MKLRKNRSLTKHTQRKTTKRARYTKQDRDTNDLVTDEEHGKILPKLSIEHEGKVNWFLRIENKGIPKYISS